MSENEKALFIKEALDKLTPEEQQRLIGYGEGLIRGRELAK